MKSKALLSAEDINRIANKHFSKNIAEYKLLKGGLFNTAYLIELESSSEKYVLRVEPRNREKLLPFEHNLPEAENYICELLEKNGIPSNRVVASDFSERIIDRKYMIFSYIDGIVLSDKLIQKKNAPNLYEQVGKITREIHELRGEYYGRVSDSFRGVTYSSWSDFIFSELSELETACVENKVISAKAFERIRALFKDGKKYFDSVTEPCLVHSDLWAGNVMVNNEQSEVLAVIDTDRCVFGDPDFDLAAPWMINENFLRGYGGVCNTEERKIKLLYYNLFYAIIDAYVWKVEYNSFLNYRKSLKNVKRLVKEIKKSNRADKR